MTLTLEKEGDQRIPKVTGIDESQPYPFMYKKTRKSSTNNTSLMNRCIPIPYLMRDNIEKELPQHFYYDPSDGKAFLVLFNPYKMPAPGKNRGTGSTTEFVLDEFENARSQLSAFTSAAQLLHQYVEARVGQPFDCRDLDVSLQHYSNVLDIVIHLACIQTQFQEDHVTVPATLHDLERTTLDHITIVVGDGRGEESFQHCHAVTNQRAFANSLKPQRANFINWSGFCDFCRQTKENSNQSAAKGLEHMSKCYPSFLVQNCGSEKILPREIVHRAYETQWEAKQEANILFRPVKRKGREELWQCVTCKLNITKEKVKNHHCRIRSPLEVPERPIREFPNEEAISKGALEGEHPNYWVFDVESAQILVEEYVGQGKIYRHVPNCIVLQPMYPMDEDHSYTFETVDEFCEFLLWTEGDPAPKGPSPFYGVGATIFGHNAGGYDDFFVVKYLEQQALPYNVLPRPSSPHKYLEVTILREKKETNIVFKDFLMFMPNSLKAIADSFGLQNQKGDFPHRFNNGKNDHYIGPIPPMDSDEDYFCLKQKKDEKEVKEFREWYAEEKQKYCHCVSNSTCTCTLPKWNFQTEIVKYCKLDCDVLAEATRKFRQQHLEFGEEENTAEDDTSGWIPTSIDPFNYSTQSQNALAFFLQGHKDSKAWAAISKNRTRSGWSDISIIWLEREAQKIGFLHKIQHAANSTKEYFDQRATQTYVDGHTWIGNQEHIYEFLGCHWHGCPRCRQRSANPDQIMHTSRNMPLDLIYEKTLDKITKLKAAYGEDNVHVMWECDFHQAIEEGREPPISEYEKELGKIIQHRDMFFGGRTEVFSAYASATPQERICHYDVTSMYPYVCSQRLLPTGVPQILFGRGGTHKDRLCRNSRAAYFGYARVKIRPNANCPLGLLPQKVGLAKGDKTGLKLQFDLTTKIGTWFTEEIYIAMDHGYVVEEIYEVHHFDERNRSMNYFKGYMSFFLRMKQESEGWKKSGASSETPREEEKDRVIEDLYLQNGRMGRMRKERVAKNPVKRAMAKLMLNCLWGKLAQDDEQRTNTKIVYDKQTWLREIYNNPCINQKTIRYRAMAGGAYTCYYHENKEYAKPNKRVNVYLASAVTAWARCILHYQMKEVGPDKVLYCDTDSVVFLKSRQDTREFVGRGLGKWTDETDEGDEILEFMALAPKSYMKVYKTGENEIKAKGVRMTVENRELVTAGRVRALMTDQLLYYNPEIRSRPLCEDTGEVAEPPCIQVNHFTIASNTTNSEYAYGEVFSRYCLKKLRVVLSKRDMVPFYGNLSSPRLELGGDSETQVSRIYLRPKGSVLNQTYAGVYSRYYANTNETVLRERDSCVFLQNDSEESDIDFDL